MTRSTTSIRVLAWITLAAMLAVAPAFAQFEARSSTPVGNRPESIAAGDFNRDGHPDLAVADGACLWILLGNGDGTFQPPVGYQVGISPQSVAAGDLNHDGMPDLVVGDYLGDLVYVLLGNGDGTFRARPAASTLTSPTHVGLANLNGDHELDLIVIDSPFVSVFLSEGDGNFTHSKDIEMPFVPNGIGWGDFDADGALDLAVAGFSGSIHEVTILLGNGDGSFRAGPSYDVGAQPVSVAVADFRAVGKLDLAVADLQGDGIDVLLGNGDGTFQTPRSYVAPFPIAVVAADVNGDGWPDLVAAVEGINGNDQSSGASVLLGNGDGTFQLQRSYPAGSFARSLAPVDLNGDHQTDIVVGADSSQFEIAVLLNTGVVSFSPTTPLSFPAQPLGTTSSPQTVTLTNNGSAPLAISSMRVQGPFSMTSTCGGTVAAGGACDITIAFAPKVRGIVAGLVRIVDSASSKAQSIELSGAGTVVSLSPAHLVFPPQKVGTKSRPQEVTLTNTGKVGLDIADITVQGRNGQDFSQVNSCGSHLSAGASCKISVTFQPRQNGTRLGSVSVWDDGGGSPQQVSLSGTGK